MKTLGHYLKIWADPHGYVRGEIKGSHLPLSYRILIVTSNHNIQDACHELPYEMYEAVSRRFTELRMVKEGDDDISAIIYKENWLR